MEKLKAFVTGATGFVGSNLLHVLVSNNYQTHVMIRENSNIWRIRDIIDQVKVHYCDITDQDRVKQTIFETRPQLIFHLATYGATSSQKENLRAIDVNFKGTVNLVDACVDTGFDCFINTGSSSEYGMKLQRMRETDVLEPIDVYGVSKAAATLYCQSIARRHDLNMFTLRLFSPYGLLEGSDRLIPYLVRSCLDNAPVILYNPDAVRDFVFIEDVINAYLNAVDCADEIASGEIFNVGSGKQHSVKEIFKIVKRITYYEKEAKIDKSSIWTRPCDEAKIWEADITKIKQAFGWEPRTLLSEGIRKTVEWFKDYFPS